MAGTGDYLWDLATEVAGSSREILYEHLLAAREEGFRLGKRRAEQLCKQTAERRRGGAAACVHAADSTTAKSLRASARELSNAAFTIRSDLKTCQEVSLDPECIVQPLARKCPSCWSADGAPHRCEGPPCRCKQCSGIQPRR